MAAFHGFFDSKTVVVTGAGKGLGREITKEFAKTGAEIYAVTRTQSDLDELVEECGPAIHPICLDISDWDATRESLSSLLPYNIDILINNAAVNVPETFMNISKESFDSLTSINLKSVVNISQICARRMIDADKGGSIINISSMLGMRPSHHAPMYSTMKAALDAMTKIMATELGPSKIRVVSVNLGFMMTPLVRQQVASTEEKKQNFEAARIHRFPMGDMWVPIQEAVNTILFVTSGLVSTMTGCNVVVDGGYTIT